jgi:hypothetical protein
MGFKGSYGQESCSCNDIINTWIEEYVEDRFGSLRKVQHQWTRICSEVCQTQNGCWFRWCISRVHPVLWRKNERMIDVLSSARLLKLLQRWFWSCELSTYIQCEQKKLVLERFDSRHSYLPCFLSYGETFIGSSIFFIFGQFVEKSSDVL